MFIRNRITYAAEDGGGAAPPAADPAPASTPPASTPPAAPPATGAPDADAGQPQSALKDTLLTAEPPKTEGEPPADPAKTEGAGEGEKAPAPEPMKPEDYTLELPEGIAADDPLLTAFLEGAAKGGMDNESVQAVVASLGPKLAEQLAAPMKAWTSLNEAWQAEVKADPVIGGDKLPATIQTVADAINLVSTPEEARLAREALTMTGAGNNPAIVRLMHRMATRLTEQRPVQGKSPAEVKSPAAVLYPTHNAAKGG
jgi:hypothetical protein